MFIILGFVETELYFEYTVLQSYWRVKEQSTYYVHVEKMWKKVEKTISNVIKHECGLV